MSSLSRWECFKILDLPSNASQDEIRQAYRTKALDNHPDKNPGDPEATERFQQISQAYRVLAGDVNGSGYSSDSDEEFGGGLDFMFMYFKMFEEVMRREARMAEARRRQRFMEEIILEELFGPNLRRGSPWQQPPHRRREAAWSPPRRTAQQTSAKTSQQTRQQASGRSSKQTNGKTSPQTSGKSPQHTSGKTSQQTSGKSSQQRSWKTSPPNRHNTSQPSKEKENPRANYQDRKSSTKNTNHTYTSFKNQQGKSSKVSDDQGSKHKPSSDPPKGGDQESDQTHKPSQSELNTTGSETKKHKPAYEKYQPTKLSKKQLLAQQKRRAREAEEIGKEIRKKIEMISNPKSSYD